MTTLSIKNCYFRSGGSKLRADDPCDVGFVWNMVDNVAHLVDESFKYRINWVGGDNADGADSHTPLGVTVTTMFFTTAMPRPDRFPRYDIRVATYSEVPGGGSAIAARIVPAEYPFVPGANDGVIGSLSSTVPNGSAWAIDDTLPAVTTEDIYINPVMPPTVGILNKVMQHMPVRLIIDVEQPGDVVRVIGVQVREYTE